MLANPPRFETPIPRSRRLSSQAARTAVCSNTSCAAAAGKVRKSGHFPPGLSLLIPLAYAGHERPCSMHGNALIIVTQSH